MKIAITGSSGFIGRSLFNKLTEMGHQCVRIVRNQPSNPNSIFWDPYNEKINISELQDIDVFVHLSGANIAEKFWTKRRKEELRISRIKTTQFLAKTIAELNNPNKLFLLASAIGYYGPNPSGIVDEDSPKGEGFLADLCDEWEKSAQPAVLKGIQTIYMRFGIVMGKDGGFLHRLIKIYRWGLGGILGNKNSFLSWISIDDLTSAICFIVENPTISGAINFVSPYPITQYELSRCISELTHRPAFIKIPDCLFRIIGTMGKELFLVNQKVYPSNLLKIGYEFKYPIFQQYLLRIFESKDECK